MKMGIILRVILGAILKILLIIMKIKRITLIKEHY